MFIVFIWLLIIYVKADWELLFDELSNIDFNRTLLNLNAYVIKYHGGLYQLSSDSLYNCNQNGRDLVFINSKQFEYGFTIKIPNPSYSIIIYIDMYIMDISDSNDYYKIKINQSSIYSKNYSNSYLMPYKSICDTSLDKLTLKTIVLNLNYSFTNSVVITINSSNSQMIGYRDLQLFAQNCHYSCKTCYGNQSNNCQSCYYGQVAYNKCPYCPQDNSFLSLDSGGCVQECPRSGFLDNGDNFCQNNRSNYSSQLDIYILDNQINDNLFTTFSSFTKTNIPRDLVSQSLSFSSINCTTIPDTFKKFVMPFYNNEGVSLPLNLDQNIVSIRLRITFLYQNWIDYTRITIFLDNIATSNLYYLNQILQYQNMKPIFSNTICKLIRIETLINVTNQNHVLNMVGSMSSTSMWGFNNITIDKVVCTQFCTVCDKQDHQCITCSTNYVKYRGKCLQQCPVYSEQINGVCTDFEDLVSYSQYIIKGFYDRLQQYDELNNIVGTFTSEGTNFETTIDKQIIFSYLPTKRILGGPLVWNKGYFTKIINGLKPHYQIQLFMTVILGENIVGDFYYKIDSTNTTLNQATSQKDNIAGKSDKEKIIKVTDSILHTQTSLTIILHCYAKVTNIVDGFCGIYDYFVVINYCHSYCQQCSGPALSECTLWPTSIPTEVLQFTTEFKCNSGYYLNEIDRPYQCQSCHQIGCINCISQNICTQCDTTLHFTLSGRNCICQNKYYNNNGVCSQCDPTCLTCFGSGQNKCLSCLDSDNRYLNVNQCQCKPNYIDQSGICSQNCGTIQIAYGQQCYDSTTTYKLIDPGCIKCSYLCDTSCYNCNSQGCQECDYLNRYYLDNLKCVQCQITEFVNSNICQSCQPPCSTCINQANKCLTCNFGYIYDGITFTCQLCITGQYFDVIQQSCQSCNKPCLSCITTSTFCTYCISNLFILNTSLGICQCIDGYVEQNYECIQCQQPCLTCINNPFQCTSCIDGFYNTQINTCEQCIIPCQNCISQTFCLNCITNLYEFYQDSGSCQCQNGYIEINNNCQQCQLPCLLCINNIDHCIQCINDNQILTMDYKCQCQIGYQMNNQFICEQINNNIIDNNNNEQDNIYNPQQDIQELQKQSELICGDNSILQQNKCLSLCGNSILDQQYEECDDGNQLGGDGCSLNCLIEEQWQCNNIQYGLSQCTFIQSPSFQLNLISEQRNQIQIVQLTFNQQVKLIQNISIETFINIIIQPETQYQLIYQPIIEANQILQDINYLINIKFIESINNPIMLFNFTISNIVNQYDLPLNILQQQISLGQPFIISTSTQQKVNTTIQMNEYMLYSMGGVSGIALLTGNYAIFFGMLDLLQQLSYLQYTAFIKPPHLTQFLQLFSKISLKPLLDQLKLDYYIAKLNGGKLPFISSNKNKNTSTPINAYYIINAKSCYLTLTITFGVYLFCSWFVNSKLINTFIKNLYNKKQKLRQKEKTYKFVFKIRWACQQQKILYFYSGLLQAFQSIEHQLVFSAFLQFPNYGFNSFFDCFNSFASVLGLIGPLIIAFIAVGKAKTENCKLIKWDYFFQGIKSKYWSVMLKAIQIIKIMVYLGSIIFLNNYPEAQSIILSITSAFYTIYLIRYSPYSSKLEQIKFIMREIFFLTATGSFLVYSFNLGDDLFNIFGWIHIGLFTSILIINLLMDLSKQFYDLYQTYLKQLKKDLLKKQKMYKFNKLQQFILVEYQKPKSQLGFLKSYK